MGGRTFHRILLIRRKALGDALVTMRAVLEVQKAWPQADIDLVIDRPFVPLLTDLAELRRSEWEFAGVVLAAAGWGILAAGAAEGRL